MSTVTDGCCIIDALCGIDTASPLIGQFTDNFDTVKFLLGDNFEDYTFMIITDIGGHVEIVNTDGESLTSETDAESGNTILIWKPGVEVTASSGVIVYQIAAYKSVDGNIESTWYSKEGRLIVTESISTTSHSAAVIGSEPNLLTKLILEIADNTSAISNLDEIKVDKEDGRGLSDENYSFEEKEKLSGIEAGAEVNVQSDWEEADKTKDSYIKNKPIIDQSYEAQSENAQSGKAVAEALAALVNGSPEALDTLNELAKALGDDPNFAATIAEEIGKKANDEELSKVAKSGDYNDLSSLPIIDTDVNPKSENLIKNGAITSYVDSQIGDIETERQKMIETKYFATLKEYNEFADGLTSLGKEKIYKIYFSGTEESPWFQCWLICVGEESINQPYSQVQISTSSIKMRNFITWEYDELGNPTQLITKWSDWRQIVDDSILEKRLQRFSDEFTVDVDQNYNANSENAQSGKAVAEALAELVNGSPEALDTLNELAKALGDDPNFAATIAQQLGEQKESISDLQHSLDIHGEEIGRIGTDFGLFSGIRYYSTFYTDDVMLSRFDSMIRPQLCMINRRNDDGEVVAASYLFVINTPQGKYRQIWIDPIYGIRTRRGTLSTTEIDSVDWEDWIGYANEEDLSTQIGDIETSLEAIIEKYGLGGETV